MSWSLVVVLVLIVLVDAWQDHRDYAKRLDSPAGPARMQRRRIMKWIFAGMVITLAVLDHMLPQLGELKVDTAGAVTSKRTLTPEQKAALKKSLDGSQFGFIKITSSMGDLEAADFAEQIRKALDDCGFSIPPASQAVMNPPATGLVFRIQDPDKVLPHQENVPKAFRAAGISCDGEIDPEIQDPTVLEIIVGTNTAESLPKK